jgi:hypothetical protein
MMNAIANITSGRVSAVTTQRVERRAGDRPATRSWNWLPPSPIAKTRAATLGPAMAKAFRTLPLRDAMLIEPTIIEIQMDQEMTYVSPTNATTWCRRTREMTAFTTMLLRLVACR